MLRFLPSKAQIWAVLSAIAAVFLAWLRMDARRDQRGDAQIKDYEHAEDIEDAVTRNRADPEQLRKYEDAGYRD